MENMYIDGIGKVKKGNQRTGVYIPIGEPTN